MANFESITLNAGDVYTKAKWDKMYANLRAEDAHESGSYYLNNIDAISAKNNAGSLLGLLKLTNADILRFGNASIADFIHVGPNGQWIDPGHTWTRTGNHTFTVPTDVTAIYRKGTKIRYKDGGSYEYGIVASSSYSAPDTTVTLAVNSDYAMANTTITDNYITYSENPSGYPHWFAFTPTWGGVSSNPTSVTKFNISGGTCKINIRSTATGTSNATTKTLVSPIASGSMQSATVIAGTDNGTGISGGSTAYVSNNTTTINFFKDCTLGATNWTASGGWYVNGIVSFGI